MSESLPFVVFALPRSRTFWASRFLSYGGWACGHDEALHVRALDDVRSWFAQPYVGTVETAAAPFWRLLHAVCPQAKVVVIRRPVSDVVTSLMALGVIPVEAVGLSRILFGAYATLLAATAVIGLLRG